MACTWSTDVTLGRVSSEAVGEAARRGPARRGTGRGCAGRVAGWAPRTHLNRIPWNGAAFPSCTDCGQGAGGGDRGGVLLGVRAVAEPVLEVDPQVLDRLGLELAGGPAGTTTEVTSTGIPAASASCSGVPPCASSAASASRAPVGDGGLGVAVGRDVDGVHRLAARRGRPGSARRARRRPRRAGRRGCRRGCSPRTTSPYSCRGRLVRREGQEVDVVVGQRDLLQHAERGLEVAVVVARRRARRGGARAPAP